MDLTTSLGRLRLSGYIEGTSLLLILFVTMPLKYMMDMPGPNKIVGMTHGILFIGYLFMVLSHGTAKQWPKSKIALGVLASIVPFGPFIFDRRLLREES
ncbi:MAG: integral membrane protein [Myxococcota bacterium]|jgi:integral membrane protein